MNRRRKPNTSAQAQEQPQVGTPSRRGAEGEPAAAPAAARTGADAACRQPVPRRSAPFPWFRSSVAVAQIEVDHVLLNRCRCRGPAL